jgi:hypothetical protein
MDPAKANALLDNHKFLQHTSLEPLTSLIDSIVVRVILPVFTSSLGDIFGHAQERLV